MQLIVLIALKAMEIYSYILIAYAFLSWFPPLYDSWIGRTILWLVRPVLRPFQRFRLQFMGLDWTVLAIILLMNFISQLLVALFF